MPVTDPPGFHDQPELEYSDPVDWHPDPIYRGYGHAGTFNRSDEIYYVTSTDPVAFEAGLDANARYRQTLGGPFPSTDATTEAWGWAQVGKRVTEGDWGAGSGVDGDADDFNSRRGSIWQTFTPTVDNPLALEAASATASISAWVLRPWTIFTYDNPWMDDEALEATYNTALANSYPGEGWFLEHERYYPFFQGFEVAPDESTTAVDPVRSEAVNWRYDMTGWGFYGYGEDGLPVWDFGALPNGTTLVSYAGGNGDWTTVPEQWLPTQVINHPIANSFEVPANEFTAAIPLTLVADSITGLLPSDNGEGGREAQTLLLRAAWKAPRFRWNRERVGVPPRRGIGRPLHRGFGTDSTIQGGTRGYGGIL